MRSGEVNIGNCSSCQAKTSPICTIITNFNCMPRDANLNFASSVFVDFFVVLKSQSESSTAMNDAKL